MAKDKEEKRYLDFSKCKSFKEAEEVLMEYYDISREEVRKMYDREDIERMYASISSVQYVEVDYQSGFGNNIMHVDEPDNTEIVCNVIKNSIDLLIGENSKYLVLLPISGTDYPIDYPLSVKKFKQLLRVFYVDENVFLCYDKDQNIVEIQRSDIKDSSSSLNSLKKEDIDYVFNKMLTAMQENIGLDLIECFSSFCSYFNYDEKQLYDSISIENQEKLVRKLSQGVNLFKSNRNF